MKILITGYKGFIGSHLYSALRRDGYDVTGYDIGDNLNNQKFDIIFHFAARGLIRKSIEMPYQYYKDDLDLTLKFLERARNDGSKFVFSTSGSTQEPTNPYSLSKKHSVEWIDLYSELYGMENYVLRFFNIYGVGSRKGAVYLFTKAALTGEKAILYGDGSHVRDFLNVLDVVVGCKRIIEEEIEPGHLEFGTGKGTSVNELISTVKKVTGKNIDIVKKDYVLKEARRLVAEKPFIKDPMSLDKGIKEVADFIMNDQKPVSNGLR